MAVRKVAALVSRIKNRIPRDPFTDEQYFPPKNAERELVVSYFFTMVALDHRLSRPGKPYEATVDGKRYHGADLLYRLGMKKFMDDPEFFLPRRLASLTLKDIISWLCVNDVCPPDPLRRLALLRDLGEKTLKLYDGSFVTIIDEANGFLRGEPGKPGFVDLLRVFDAYGDPIEKKTMLLAKFLERRGLFNIRDVLNKRVPVDNHVSRIALRLELVTPAGRMREKIVRGIGFEWWEDVFLRMAIREAWFMVSIEAGIDPFVLDDFLWSMGRKVCIYGKPFCDQCSHHESCVEGRCVFAEVCPIPSSGDNIVNEHFFIDTWWY